MDKRSAKARMAGATDDEIMHTLLLILIIQTTGFPTSMEAYTVFKNIH